MLVITAEELRQLLFNFTTTGGRWEDVVIGLYQNDVTPGPGTVLADLDGADFGGYAAVTLTGTWGDAYVNAQGQPAVDQTALAEFDWASSPANTVYGYFVVRASAPTVLIYAERFPDPIQMLSLTSHIGILARLAGLQLAGTALVSA